MSLTLDDIRSYCLSLSDGVTEDMPFGDDVLVFRIDRKIFLLANLVSHPVRVNLKCDPARAIELRERYEAVRPGYHMNKKHWNTVVLDGSVPRAEVFEMIGHSLGLVAPRSRATARRRPKAPRRKPARRTGSRGR